jgi:YbbR domain-containing protein
MIAFIRKLFFHDFWLKLFSLTLAVLIWLTVSFAIKKDVSPVASLTMTISKRTFSGLPLILLSSAADVRDFKVTPKKVEVTVQGDDKILQRLREEEIRVIVDLTGIESARDLSKRVEVSTPAGVTHVKVVPEEVQVSILPKRAN